MTNIEHQIQAMESLADRHYPDDQAQRNECLVRLLTERLRSFHELYVKQNRAKPMNFDELRRSGFSAEEIALGMQDVVRG